MGAGGGAYLTRLASFSSIVMASTRAAALSAWEAVTSQTRLSAKGPFSQSGNSNEPCAVVDEASNAKAQRPVLLNLNISFLCPSIDLPRRFRFYFQRTSSV